MRKILDYICGSRKSSASIAKERLQIIIAHERTKQQSNEPEFLKNLQQEIIQVIAKYVQIDIDEVKVGFETIGDSTVLEVNVPLKERATASETD